MPFLDLVLVAHCLHVKHLPDRSLQNTDLEFQLDVWEDENEFVEFCCDQANFLSILDNFNNIQANFSKLFAAPAEEVVILLDMVLTLNTWTGRQHLSQPLFLGENCSTLLDYKSRSTSARKLSTKNLDSPPANPVTRHRDAPRTRKGTPLLHKTCITYSKHQLLLTNQRIREQGCTA